MKRVLVLSTGGTIACTPTGDGLVPTLTGEQLTEMIPELAQIAQVFCRQLCNMDSTNVQPEEWNQMMEEIERQQGNYDGIVILHGTDTMAYTASALSFGLPTLSIPVILTGSQLPMGDPDTDAKENVRQAVCVAVQGKKGVFVVFSGNIIRGVRAKKMYTQELEAFQSINEEPAGIIKEGQVLWKEESKALQWCQVQTECREQSYFATQGIRIAIVEIYPGMDQRMLELLIEDDYDGIIIKAFGSGGVPNSRRNLLPQIRRAVQKGITVILTTQCIYDGTNLDLYEVGVLAKQLGVLSGRDMTIEALVTKLMWVLGQTRNRERIDRMMNTCYVGEFTQESKG